MPSVNDNSLLYGSMRTTYLPQSVKSICRTDDGKRQLFSSTILVKVVDAFVDNEPNMQAMPKATPVIKFNFIQVPFI